MSINKFVVDASIVVAYLLDDEKSAIADAVIGSLKRYKAIAPPFLSLEVSNVFLSAEKRRRITSEDRPRLIGVVKGFEITEESHSQERIFSRVLPIAAYHGLSTYDAAYLELASRLSIPLATLDKKLRFAAQSQGVFLFDGES
ncbi:MAG: type II toxin-antitoxin system VapC family toxin [Chthoniobacterales bacterium]|nr:type II toxin-antitoxin system VapC family toxin [Chthoniobacterales bacterium]